MEKRVISTDLMEEDYKIENIELLEGSYEDSVDDSDIKLEVTSEEDRKLMKDLMKDI